ncbi:MAG: hypothetical protein J3R72DRAFT_436842 [Linnemannia gamsii]|nr:MAG: hypothetical protein J3R72DRAFT_436842 [Linnemannia gamsii]
MPFCPLSSNGSHGGVFFVVLLFCTSGQWVWAKKEDTEEREGGFGIDKQAEQDTPQTSKEERGINNFVDYLFITDG